MERYEFKVVPAPKRCSRIRGIRGAEERFAQTVANVMNQYGSDGWEFLRAEALPMERRRGLMGRLSTNVLHMLIFRRVLPPEEARAAEEVEAAKPAPLTAAPPAAAAAPPAPVALRVKADTKVEKTVPPREPPRMQAQPAGARAADVPGEAGETAATPAALEPPRPRSLGPANGTANGHSAARPKTH